MQVYLDMDGVFADFDTGYERAFGVRPSKADDNVDWSLVRDTPDFFKNLPLMPGALKLWDFVSRLDHKPIFLTGCPASVPEAPANKQAFIPANLPGGDEVEVITCRSREKYLYCRPGDVLIDDWEKYKPLWIGAGGNWITHTSADESIRQLDALLNAS